MKCLTEADRAIVRNALMMYARACYARHDDLAAAKGTFNPPHWCEEAGREAHNAERLLACEHFKATLREPT